MVKAKPFLSLLLALATCFISVDAIAGSIDSTEWQRMTADEAFRYKDEIETITTNNSSKGFEKAIMLLLAFFASPVGRILLWCIFFIFIGWVLFRVFVHDDFGIFGRKRKLAFSVEGNDQPDIAPMEHDWKQLTATAAEKGDYTMAIRYGYMWTLQLLNARDLIDYEDDKTNMEYYHELKKEELKQEFRKVYRLYEYAWYGRYQMDKEQYQKLNQSVNSIKNMLPAV
jgi:hypothetical protein